MRSTAAEMLGYGMLCVLLGCVATAHARGDGTITADTAVKVLAQREPQVGWKPQVLTTDVTLDRVMDAVVLGLTDRAVLVGVVEGPITSTSRVWSLPFLGEIVSPGSSCGAPGESQIFTEPAGVDLQEVGCDTSDATPQCAELRQLASRLDEAAARGSRGLRLVSGDCDAIHIYFDGTKFGSWRR